MFLIDSSVWIEYLRPKGSAKIKEKVRELLELGVVVVCGVVLVEILRGAKNKGDFDLLYDTFFSLPQIPLNEGVIKRASKWGFEMDRKGKAVSTTDLIILQYELFFEHCSFLSYFKADMLNNSTAINLT